MKDFKRLLKEFIPPILLKIGKNRNPLKSCLSYDEAEFLSKKGYQNSELVELIITKTLNYASEIERNVDCNISELIHLIGISAVSKSTINVIDFGGAAGCHYFSARKTLPKNITLNWCVVETDLMVHECNKKIEIPNLKFFKTIADAQAHLGNIDLVISNSALQYTQSPIASLKALLGTEAENIFIVRTPFNSSDKPLFYVQSSLLGGNGPGKNPENFKNIDKRTEYPLTVESLQNFRREISVDYHINLLWKEDSNAFDNKESEIRTYGFMASRKFN